MKRSLKQQRQRAQIVILVLKTATAALATATAAIVLEALITVICLALLVFCLIERHVRVQIAPHTTIAGLYAGDPPARHAATASARTP